MVGPQRAKRARVRPPNGRAERPASSETRAKGVGNESTVREREPERTYPIDFGLGYYTDDREEFAMDLHVFEQSLVGTADAPERLLEAFETAYREAGDPRVLDRLREIEGRGRYQ